MRALLIARDVAPSQILERVQFELHSRGHETFSVLGSGKAIEFDSDSIVAMVLSSNFVLVGMSSTAELSKEEIFAAQIAMDNSIPFGFICDIFDCYKRPWFAPFREKAGKLFVVAEAEIAEAKALFPNAEVVASGNPCWEDFFDRMSLEEEKTLWDRYGLSPERKTILAVGGKDLMLNMAFFGGVISAASYNERLARSNEAAHLEKLPKFQVLLSVHPGDPNDASIYGSLMNSDGGGLSRVPVALDKGTKPEKLLAIADLVVVLGSSVGIAAACQRKPVINYFTELYRKKIEDGGGWPWKPCSELGIAELVTDCERPHLSEMISWLTQEGSSWWSQAMRIRQEKAFPELREKGAAVRKICDALGAFPLKSE